MKNTKKENEELRVARIAGEVNAIKYLQSRAAESIYSEEQIERFVDNCLEMITLINKNPRVGWTK
jgi:hypothetical protein